MKHRGSNGEASGKHSRLSASNGKAGSRVLSGEVLPPHPPAKRARATLRTLDDVSAELARLYRKAERGQIPTADASRLTYVLLSLGKVLEAIEARNARAPIAAEDMPTLQDFYALVAFREEVTHND